MKKMGQTLFLAVIGIYLPACSTIGDITHLSEVPPWERGVLAKENMQLVSDPMDALIDDHIYFSREASTGGSGLAGGGCGCN